jgi:hypothetical protein
MSRWLDFSDPDQCVLDPESGLHGMDLYTVCAFGMFADG